MRRAGAENRQLWALAEQGSPSSAARCNWRSPARWWGSTPSATTGPGDGAAGLDSSLTATADALRSGVSTGLLEGMSDPPSAVSRCWKRG